MKRKKLLNALNGIDDKYVREADPSTNRKLGTRALAGILAASFSFLAVFNLWLFLPRANKAPSVAKYADSEYYGVIEKINLYQHKRKKTYKNNFNMLWSKAENFAQNFAPTLDGSDMSGAAGGSANGSGAGRYEEVTDNQTDGVIEADRIKRSDTHIYHLAGSTLSVYSINGDASEKVGTFDLSTLSHLAGNTSYHGLWEFFLSADCKTVTVIAPYYNFEDKEAFVSLVSLNVESPKAITVKETFSVSGSYLSSRKTEDGILLFTRFSIRGSVDFDKKETYLPKIERGEVTEFLPAESIFSPEELSTLAYTVVLKVGEDGLSLGGVSAFLSYSEEVYVSEENVYAIRTYNDVSEDGGIRFSKAKSEISYLSYRDGFSHKGSFTVDGRVLNRYSLDEYEGTLRVFTTLSESRVLVKEDGVGNNASVGASVIGGGTNAALYLVSLADHSLKGKVERFAPDGESVRSARFDGVNAYACTSIEMKDPVFFFDLSDPENITYKETGTIEGFSTSLVDFGEDTLLGIGVGGWNSVKLEIYTEGENGVIPLSAYEIERAGYSSEYKAYYIDRENRLVGLGIVEWQSGESYYLVLLFDGYELRELAKLPIKGDYDAMRGVYINGYFYAFGSENYAVEKIAD